MEQSTILRRSKRIRAAGRKPGRFSEGRVCEATGCTTILSQYNSGVSCFLHAQPRFCRVRGRK